MEQEVTPTLQKRGHFYFALTGLPDTLDLAGKRKFLDFIVNKEVMALKAEELKYGEDPRVVSTMKMLADNLAGNAAVARLTKGKLEPTEEEIEAFWDKKHEKILAKHILVKTRKEAEELRKKLVAGANFDSMAPQYSQVPRTDSKTGEELPLLQRVVFGDVQYGEAMIPVEEAVFLTKIGEISQPVETGYGWHLFMPMSTSQVTLPPLDPESSRRISNSGRSIQRRCPGCQPDMRHWVDRNVERLGGLLLPPRCVLCGSRGQAPHLDLCIGCQAALGDVLNPVLVDHGLLRRCYAPFAYAAPLDHLVHSLKYRGHPATGRLLGTLLADRIAALGLHRDVDVIVPVPLHPARHAERGFNQSAEIARHLGRRLRLPLVPGDNAALAQLRAELAEYFAGQRRAFEVPLHVKGSPFQERVWQELVRIPYGETRSYEEIAQRVGSAGAVRAVGLANGMNRIAIVIPCHRGVNKDGYLP